MTALLRVALAAALALAATTVAAGSPPAAPPARAATTKSSGTRPATSTGTTTQGRSTSGQAHGDRSGSTPPPTHVEADHIEYRYKERETVMTGKPLVRLVREDAVLLCRKLVTENDEAGEIRHAVCEGDVKLTRGDRVVTCARATYEAAIGRLVCRGDRSLSGGDPVLRDGASVMACDELVYELDQDRVQLTRPKGTLVQKPGQAAPVARGKQK
jgi:lipopolysaccharide export system protein LptA